MDAETGTDARGVAGERGQLLNVAYRLIGSLTEAEDAVQEAYARWYGLAPARRAAVQAPGAWLTTVTARVCLDVLGSARARRERYVGTWLPEPLPGVPDAADPDDPAARIVLDESVSMAFLVVLEAMTPAERVAFVLHDVFRYPFAEIAGVLGRSAAACRRLASSGRRRLGAARSAGPIPLADRAAVVRHVKEAWESRDIPALVGLLDPAAVMTADGGGLAGAALHPVEGAAGIARYMVAIADRAPGLSLRLCDVNGLPGLAASQGGAVRTVAAFELDAGRVARIWVIRNPEKLGPWVRGAEE
ncbi:RNA polymerase ECF-subfamily sigma factor [Streptomyces sp. SPB78]|uniref:RNA polymerase sigma factor SigJ n=1 Tax=Streptomyces sp. (strain SPB78) TaxID=591157 RepID=UPI0001B578CC|nr:RNA polymerase sigma factor SigJ [Streptomyces sp. SPB78]EFL00386.1 RNA polymerase ECF-subfamily sigma factor [Streptomyces sp. SPB78]